MKRMSYDEALNWTRRRVDETVKQGRFPKDVLAMMTLAVEAHKAHRLRENEDRIRRLKTVLEENGKILPSDWKSIIPTLGSTITVA